MAYWSNRIIDEQEKIQDASVESIMKQLAKYYNRALRLVTRSFEEIVDKAEDARSSGTEITPAWLYQLDKYYRMQAELRDILHELGDDSIEQIEKKFVSLYANVYDHFNLPQSSSFFNRASQANAEAAIKTIWCSDGKNYSQRIWGNTELIAQRLNDDLVSYLVTGRKTQELKQQIADDFGVAYRRANTLVRTEAAHVTNTAALNRYKDAGIKKVKFLGREAGLPKLKCDCRELDGKIFTIETVPVIPRHTNCRCAITPIVE